MRFQVGQSGNPGGRPRSSLTAMLRRELGRSAGDRTTVRTAIARKLVALAVAGNLDAIKIVFDRVDGKVPELRTFDGAASIVLRWDDSAESG